MYIPSNTSSFVVERGTPVIPLMRDTLNFNMLPTEGSNRVPSKSFHEDGLDVWEVVPVAEVR